MMGGSVVQPHISETMSSTQAKTYDAAPSTRVAFIGLGVMGYPMAGHLAQAGHAVTVYNRNPAKAKDWSIIIFLAVPVFIVIFIEKIQQLDNSGPSCDLSQRTAAR